MKTFYLTVNNNMKDVIAKVKADTLEQAIIYFSKTKHLPIDDLLKIYTVVQ